VILGLTYSFIKLNSSIKLTTSPRYILISLHWNKSTTAILSQMNDHAIVVHYITTKQD